MDKMRMESLDMTAQNIEKIGALFPNCITETVDEKGKPKKAINFELLKQMLSADVLEGSEAYEFTWVGKKAAIVEANKPIRKTLRPCKEESVNWDTTENLYIEGDNLEVLKLLQESYLGAIKMIYIDPPYNTGNDFIYRDDFGVDSRQWLVDSGQYDEEGNRMFRNTDSNGRFHSDWCSMMYSRLMLARNLLAEDGVIFISIDDNEQHNMKKIADEVFGEDNFLAQVIWERAFAPVNLKKHFSESHDYVICYAKNLNNAICNGLPRNEEANNRYSNPDNDPRGVWMSSDMTVGPVVNSKLYEIISPNGTILRPASGRCWLFTKERFEEMKKDNRIWFGPDGNNMPRVKKFLSEVKQGLTPMTIWKYSEVGHSQDAAQRLKDLFGGKSYFDYPKSVELLKRCIQLYSDKDCFVLDFFSGSATTAHAVMKLNAEDGGKRKFIMVQLPEVTDENSEAYKDGYKTICDIGKERIRRAGRLISGQLIVDSGQLIVDSGQLIVDSGQLIVDSGQWMVGKGQNGGGKDGDSEFQGIADMAKGNVDCEGDLFSGEETSKGRDLCTVRPDEKSGSVDSVKHSGGTVQKFNEGVYSVFSDSERVKGGAGNTTSSLQGNRLSNGRGNTTRNEFTARGEQNASCNESETSPPHTLTTNHYQLPTNHYQLDTGFRVFKLDDTNMTDVYYAADEYSQDLLPKLESNVKSDRTDLDLLFGCLLEWGLPLSLPYTSETIEGCTVHTYNDGDLIACFDENIPDSVIKTIAKRQPLRAVFRDSSFASSPSKINVGEIFKLLAPDTRVKVI